jgi:hypothetical protein
MAEQQRSGSFVVGEVRGTSQSQQQESDQRLVWAENDCLVHTFPCRTRGGRAGRGLGLEGWCEGGAWLVWV